MERFKPKKVAAAKKQPPKSDRSKKAKVGGNYFPDAGATLNFVPTGCSTLNCVIGGPGGGYPLGRVVNIVGDRSTGKTLLAIEAMANFAKSYPKGRIWYRESEAAFDIQYAQALGLPTSRIDFGKEGIGTHWDTIETVWEDIEAQLDKMEKAGEYGGIYIIDSLDALSSRAALKREIGKGSYDLDKPKVMSKLFQDLIRRLQATGVCLIFVSQTRDKINAMFGDKHTRSGGKALDFYASIVLWLSQLGTIYRTVNGIKRPVGVKVKVKCKKNKISTPLRQCDVTIRFGFGVDDLESSLEFLESVKQTGLLGLASSKEVDKYIADADKFTDGEYKAELIKVQEAVEKAWTVTETTFLPKRRKYAEA